ncbi:MAG: SDR family NAD(P)-dependent oxidoreductase [Lysobacter sp.]|nr:MAG: SDR family NAD(P)-dependent oxidoreductase [Lysobacter sp.]
MSTKRNDIAIIGMSGKFPGADSVSEFWDNLCAKRESIRAPSDEDLRDAGVHEADLYDPAYVRACAPLNDVDMFDPAFFKISPLEAEMMDPQIRLLLQCAWETLEDAGHARREAQNIGVFAGGGGAPTSYFANFVNRSGRFEKVTASPTHLGNDKDFLATYISYKLNLTGPSMTVQTACSTSLVALHQARLSLLAGECEMALAGGVSVRVPHAHGYLYKEGYIFSKSGRIRSFDEGADGVVFGSGLALVLIKRLADAVRDGDHIYAVIKGSAIANDGKGKMSYAASSAKGQIACVRQALANAGVAPDTIGFVESHGTGTAMGDPEEVKALSAAFKEHTSRKGFCALGAVKTNVGHLEAAAGIVGLIKATLAVYHGAIPPTLHYANPNPRIKFENTPFFVNAELREWRDPKGPRRAAVNSLGVGGTNAFVVLEEYAPTKIARKKPANGPVVVPLSAKTADSLRAYAGRLLAALETDAGRTLDIVDLAYTLQTGRDEFERRVAFVVEDIDGLRTALTRFLEGHAPDYDRSEEATLAASWSGGGDADWHALYPDAKPRRVSLPTTVFARERYWVETPSPAPIGAKLHPLLHLNTSDLNEQKYSSVFTGEEFFLKDHRVRIRAGGGEAKTQKVLPGVAYLEMARAAVEHAAPIHCDASELLIRDVFWLQPIAVAGERHVNIALVARSAANASANGAVGSTTALEPQPQIDFEVYTQDDQIHCQGRASYCPRTECEDADLAALHRAMRQGRWTHSEIYAIFARMGLDYGPAHRPLASIERGERESLATLKLPENLAAGRADYVLHPSLLDGALQAATTLLFERNSIPNYPIVPFALESLRVVGPCEGEMLAWSRYAAGSRPGDKSTRLDIDLFASTGKLCAQIRGFTARRIGKRNLGALIATRAWRKGEVSPVAVYAEPRVLLCGFPKVDAARIARDCAVLDDDPTRSPAERYAHLAEACFVRLQEMVRSRPQTRTLLQVAVARTDDNALFVGLAGLMKTAHLENPQVSGQILLVDPDVSTEAMTALLHAERGRPHDTLIRFENGERQVAGWDFLQEDAPNLFEREGAFKDRGVYLITGGLGGLGVLFAREILARTANATVVLSGRTGPAEIAESAEKLALLESLQAQGARVEYLRLDLDDEAATADAIASIVAQHGQLNGILHSAGAIADAFLFKKELGEFRTVMAPKVRGTWHLDRATRDLDLDFLVLFSSLTSALGNLGQADYAAANGFMDEFAAYRNRLSAAGRRRGMTVAIRWPLWEEGGMRPDDAGREQLHDATGIYPMRSKTGMRMFYRSLASGCDQTVVMEGDLNLMQRALGIGAAIHATPPPSAPPQDLRRQEGEGSLAESTEAYLCRQLAGLLKLSPSKIDPAAPLENYGIDSILALDLTRLLEHAFGALPKTLFFEYLTIRELAGYFVGAHAATLATMFTGALPAAAPPPAPPAATTAAVGDGIASIRGTRRAAADAAIPTASAPAAALSEPIAIVGLSGRYPESPDLEAFWRNLRDGKDCIVEVPASRWDWREYYSEDRTRKGHHFSKWGGFIEGVDEFDARFFNISPVEAELIDPQERLFLQHAWMAIEDAGFTRAALRIPNGDDLPAQVGVYAGVMYGEYQLLGAEASLQGQRMGFASNPASVANRVSYVLNLHGPSMTVDTMCSSSLTAIHLACQDLRLGRTALGIAGGVNITIHPNKYLMLSAGQFISGDGHCQSFGEGGDGYIPGEGVGVAVLKRLSDAERDGNHIYGLIRGSALSHGGKTNGYTVPNPQAQASAVRQAFAEADIDARRIGYIEAHGTGTKLGDPIEIAALSKVFRESTDETGFCLIGSAKSNIGHAEAAAGIAGLTKVLLQMRHGQIVPSLHSSKLNPHIDFDITPFVVVQALQPWPRPSVDGRSLPRIAGVSSFGAGGANAHVVIEEYIAPTAPLADGGGAQIVPLSARTSEQLRRKAEDLLAHLRAYPETPLNALAYTLQVGREAMDERLALHVDSVAALTDALRRHLAGEDGEGIFAGEAKAGREAFALLNQDPDLDATVGKWIEERKYAKLAELWARGLSLDWRRFHKTRPTLLTGLPTYPFARQRHWVDVPKHAQASTTALHPLLHANTSDFERQRYTSRFGGREPFLDAAGPTPSLGVGATLEMARAALRDAVPTDEGAVEFRDLAWAFPAPAAIERAIHLSLFDRQGEGVDTRLRFEIHDEDDAGRETVHSHGVVGFVAADTADMAAALRDAPDARVLPLPTLEVATASSSRSIASARMLDAALRAAADLAGGLSRPLTAASLRVYADCADAREVVLRVGEGPGAIDLDLRDANGGVCARMRGVRFLPQAGDTDPAPTGASMSPSAVASASVSTSTSTSTSSTPAVAAPRSVPLRVVSRAGIAADPSFAADAPSAPIAPIPPKPSGIALPDPLASPTPSADAIAAKPRLALDPSHTSRSIDSTAPAATVAEAHSQTAHAPAALDKPRGVALLAPQNSRDAQAGPTLAKPRLTLGALSASAMPMPVHGAAAPVAAQAALYDQGDGVFVLRLFSNDLSSAQVDTLLAALRTVAAEPQAKTLAILGSPAGFLSGGAAAHADARAAGLYRALAEFPYPIVAACGRATGAGLLVAALCDALLLDEAAEYGLSDGAWTPTDAEDMLHRRFGRAAADDLLYLRTRARGAELRAAGWRCEARAADALEPAALALAANLAGKTGPSLRLLKAHLGSEIAEATAAMAAADDYSASWDIVSDAPSPISRIADALGPHRDHIALEERGDRTVVATFAATQDGIESWLDALRALLAAAAVVQRPLVLRSALPGFLPDVDASIRDDVAARLRATIGEFPLPLVAALGAETRGLGWYAALLCDACVYDADGVCALAPLSETPTLAGFAAAALAQRHGEDIAHELMLVGGAHDGAALRERFGAFRVATGEGVVAAAAAVVDALAALAPSHVRAWKARNAEAFSAASPLAFLPEPIADDAPTVEPPAVDAAQTAPKALPFGNAVVNVFAHANGVYEVRMADREARNMFSPEFSRGMQDAFARIARDEDCKAVVLVGYDNYFSSGGTRETLLSIHDGSARFTDNLVFQLPLTCPVPVIAAMQGHGIGAGWAMGMYADFALFSAESRYFSPYMGYGFTPGAGSTLLFPLRIGRDLARETLLTAQEYVGADLKARGLRQQVLPRDRVLREALALAARIARQPLARLKALKARWSTPLLAPLERTYARELDMHAQTFVGQADTLARIQGRFANADAAAHVSTADASATAAAEASTAAPTATAMGASTPTASADRDPRAVRAHLRSLLAHELRMQESEIGDDDQFVDLGLDSITGVTWIRRINEHYGTAIEAIRVYSYPTLSKLAQFVLQEAAASAPSVAQPSIAQPSVAPTPVVAAEPQPVQASAVDPRAVRAHLRSLLAHELRMQESEIGDDDQFVDLGLDSITGVTWIRRINEHYGTAIEAIRVYSYPTLSKLAQFVLQEAGPAVSAPVSVPASAPLRTSTPAAVASASLAAVAVSSATRASDTVVVLPSWRSANRGKGARASLGPIAVIGMAGRFAQSPDLDRFWRNLAEGRDCIAEIPEDRWDIDAWYQAGDVAPGKTYARWMGALDDYDRFDAAFFNISPREARTMDPQQRVFLEACWHGIEHAGYAPKSLAGTRCGVFAGCSMSDYHLISARERLSGQGFTGAAASILAARISYFLDLHGPSLSIDTACSSSLVTIAAACDSLAAGGSDLALAGGVNVMAGPSMQVMTSQVGMLSPHGRCYAFDARADGIVNGEGVGVAVLKRLTDAERDGDRIYAVVEGWGANQDGRTNGITAPNADAQTRLQREVYDRFGIDPDGIQFIEAHGTGTALGDPIEIAGLKASFRDRTARVGYCAIGSVKSNIGHCLTAAGVSGFLKLLLALQHRQLPPTAHFRTLNPHIRLDDSPFYINDRLREWVVPAGARRRAAINAFGFSGTNAHVVLAEYVASRAQPPVAAGPVLVPLSARTPEQLRQRVRDLLAWLQAQDAHAPSLEGIARTLQIGREAMEERLAIVADDIAGLTSRLRAAESDPERAAPGEGRYRGQVSANRDTLAALASDSDFLGVVGKWVARRELGRLADLWVKGLELPWDGFYAPGAIPQRLGLPGYPFARERHWLLPDRADDGSGSGGVAALAGASALHPLLHANVSDLAGQRYASRYANDAFFLVGRDGGALRALSSAACIELARAAFVHAMPGVRDDDPVELRALLWGAAQPAETTRIALAAQDDGGALFEIFAEGHEDAPICGGEAHARRGATPERIDVAALRARMPTSATSADALYARFEASGMRYGSGLRALTQLRMGAGELLAEAVSPSAVSMSAASTTTAESATDRAGFRLHPALLEAAIQAGIAVFGDGLTQMTPVAIDSVLAFAPCIERATLWARLRDPHCADIDLCDDEGRVRASLRGLRPQIAMPALDAQPQVAVAPQARAATPSPVSMPTSMPAASAPLARSEASIPALETLRQELRESLAEALFMSASDIDPQRSFTELGLDSIIGVEWVKAINRRYGTELSATRVYDYPSVAELAAHVHAQLRAATPAAEASTLSASLPTPQNASAASTAFAAAPAPAVVETVGIAALVVALETLRQELRASLAEALFMSASDIDPQRSFTELGLDSIIGVEWVKAINRRYGTELSATRVYDYPSVAELAAHVHAQLRAVAPTVEAKAEASTPSASLPAPQNASAASPVFSAAGAPAVAGDLDTVAPVVALETLREELRASLAEALFMSASDIDPQRSFTELGLDSIIGVEWVKAINRRYGTELSATRVYDYPSVAELAAHVHAQLRAAAPVVEPAAAKTSAPSVPTSSVPMANAPSPTAVGDGATRGAAPIAAIRSISSRIGGIGRGTPLGRGIRFAPKYAQAYRELSFYSADASGDIDSEAGFSVRLSISPEDCVGLREHVVFGEHLLPTDAYLELVCALYRSYFAPSSVRLERLSIVNPILGAKRRKTQLRLDFRRLGEGLQFFLRSSRSGAFDDAVLHMQGVLVAASATPPAPRIAQDFAIGRSANADAIPTNAGRFYAPLRALHMGQTLARGDVSVAEHEERFAANPFALYGALCTAINFAGYLAASRGDAGDDQFLPYRIDAVNLYDALEGRAFHCRAEALEIGRDAMVFALELVDDQGRLAAAIERIELRRVPRRTIREQARSAAAQAAAPQPGVASDRDTAVAIIGMSGRYPMSPNVEALWDNLREGRDCVSEIPAARWGELGDWYHPDPRHPRTSYSKWAGLLDDVDAFDALFFGISPAEAEAIDPQQRVFLEESWKTIESAGYSPSALSGTACGVYVGCGMGDYGRVLADHGKDTVGAAFMGTSTAILAARIAYFLNLKGPALAIDTACSSSLVAVHLACESIRSGENRLALAGGVNVLTTPLGHVLTSQVGMPSRDGRCAAFDASANGIVFSEGCGVVLLKTLADAERDGDEILGVIRASGINQDGKTNGITAPSAKSQERLLRGVYERFGIEPSRISYVEAHGTATALGDPIEVDALTAAFEGVARGQCAIGSIKSNIGHCGYAAGVASIIKVLSCIRHRTLVPSIHFSTPNPHIDFERSPFRVNTRTRSWESDGPRLATVSSFGFSGTNAHLVIEEHLPTAEARLATPAPCATMAVPLSARSQAQLRRQVEDLLASLRREGDHADLARIAYTLQTGRDAMPQRLAVVADSVAQLRARLERVAAGETRIEGVFRGDAGRDDAIAAFAGDAEMGRVIDTWIAQKNLPRVLELWVRGLALDWRRLHEVAPRRLSLPTYPFARDRCWAEGEPVRKRGASASGAAALHPLLHRNVSDLGRQAYASVFDGAEFFLDDHRVGGRPVLPAVAYLEMAGAALRDAMPQGETSPSLELRHVAWSQPLVAQGETRVEIAVFPAGEGAFEFEIASRRDGEGDDTLHCQGAAAVLAADATPAPLDLRALRARLRNGRVEASALYPRFAAMGLGYGAAFQGIVALERGEDDVLVELRLPDAAHAEGFVLHPSLADSALQGSIALIDRAAGGEGKPSLPFALEALRVYAPCAPRMYAWVRFAADGRAVAGLTKVDVDLCDADGRICAQMRGFSSRPIEREAASSAFDETHYLSIIDAVLNRRLSADEAMELG